VVEDLKKAGVSASDISLVAHDAEGQHGRSLGTDAPATTDASAAGAGVGAVLGGLGGLLVGLGALAIPGIGPVLAAGPLGTALAALVGAGVGAVAGGVTGGLIGALVDMGVPEQEAHYYSEGVRRGGVLVTARVEDADESRARDLMNRYSPVDINQRVTAWRQTGWTAYDPSAKPFTSQEVADERARYSARTGNLDMDGANYWRRHYQTTFSTGGRQYEYYEPAYRYGQFLRDDDRYHGWEWNKLEPEARRTWQDRYPNTLWDDIKDAVRHGWERVKNAVTD
jgi:hypothetical protein